MTEYSRETLRADVSLSIEPISRGKAMRAKCLDCCAGSPSEVARCHIKECPLWPFRFGTNPFSERKASPAAIAALAAHRASKEG